MQMTEIRILLKAQKWIFTQNTTVEWVDLGYSHIIGNKS